MDKQLIDHRRQTADNSTVSSLQSLVCSLLTAAMIILCSAVSDAATTTAKTSGKSASTATTATTTTKTSAPQETMTALSRAVAAGKAVSKRALSSREKVTAPAAEATQPVSEASSPESIAFQKKIENLSQSDLPKDKRVSPPAKASAAQKKVAIVPEPEEPKPVKRTTVGTVTGINDRGLAVEYAQDKDGGGREVWINFDKKIKAAGGLSEVSGLEVGDKVSAIFNEYPNKSKKLIDVKLLRKKPVEKEGR